jgi:hypothetical protein
MVRICSVQCCRRMLASQASEFKVTCQLQNETNHLISLEYATVLVKFTTLCQFHLFFIKKKWSCRLILKNDQVELIETFNRK